MRDYESAKHYLSLYLSVKEDSPLAHKLHGQIWEALGDKVRALDAYKTSLQYDPKQADLLLKGKYMLNFCSHDHMHIFTDLRLHMYINTHRLRAA